MFTRNKRHMLNYAIFLLIVSIVLNIGVFADELSTIKKFEIAKGSQPELIAFLKEMPKGADLHTHASGAVYGETILDAAIKSNLFYDPATASFYKEQGKGMVPAGELFKNSVLSNQFLDSISMRGVHPDATSGHDHFFAAFGYFDMPLDLISPDQIISEIVKRAMAQNIQYMELMTAIADYDAIKESRKGPPQTADMEKAFNEIQKKIPVFLKASKKYLDERDRNVAKILGIKPPITGVAGPINIKYIYSVNRLIPNDIFFSAVAMGMAVMQKDKRVVALNIVSPEDDVRSRQNFDTQMKIIDFLWNKFGKPNITLHAGELTLNYSPFEVMSSRIRKCIEIGHAKRIGHGVSIAWEDDLKGLLDEMKKKHIAVEICLTSNEGILGVAGNKHPFNLYRHAGIPLNLNTDDEAVNRSNLTMEFVKAVETYSLTYIELKSLVMNSIEYSFLPGESLYIDGDYSKLAAGFEDIRKQSWKPSPEAIKKMAKSEKMTVQVRLERAFVEFEK